MNNDLKIFVVRWMSILCILLPISLITGPLFSDLIVTIIAITFLVYCIYSGNMSYFNNNFFKYFIIFYAVCLVSSLLSDYKLISSLKSLVYLRFAIFSLALCFILSMNNKIINHLFISLFLCFLILILDGFLQYFSGQNILGFPIYGSYLARLLPTLIALFFLSNFKKKKINVILFSVTIISTFVIIFLSAERAAFLLAALSIIYLIVMINNFSKYFFLILAISSILIFILGSQNTQIKNRMVDLTKNQIGIDSKNFSNISPIYKGHFLIAKDLFMSNKLIGVGPKNFTKHCYNNPKYSKSPYRCSTHPHNTYIQLLAETGIAGFSMIFFLFILLSLNSAKHIFLRNCKKKELFKLPEICLLGSMLITLWPIVSSGSFFNNYINIIYYLPIGIFLYLRETKLSFH